MLALFFCFLDINYFGSGIQLFERPAKKLDCCYGWNVFSGKIKCVGLQQQIAQYK